MRRILEWLLATSLIARLVDRNDAPLTDRGVFFWWEKRRWLFNALVGVAGLVTYAVAVTLFFLDHHCDMPDPLLALGSCMVYGFGANVLYTTGWLAEVLARLVGDARSARKFGAAAFALGTAGTVVLTLSCAALLPMFCFAWQLLQR